MLADKFKTTPNKKPAAPRCDCVSAVLSPSQIDSYTSCQRRWGFRKLAQLPDPEKSFQEGGKIIHDYLETYALKGVLPDRTARLATPAWKVVAANVLPPPNPKHRCEKHIRYGFGGVLFHGFPDLDPYRCDEIVDYKTVSVRDIPFEFALTEEDLRKDPQGLIYAGHKVINEGARKVTLKWIYGERKYPFRVRVVNTVLTDTETREGLAKHVLPAAEEILFHREQYAKALATRGGYVNTLTANTKHCQAYGGCPFINECTAYKKPTLSEKFLMANSAADVMNRIDALKGGKKKAAVNPPADEPEENVGDTGEDVDDEEAQLLAALAAKKAEKAAAAAVKAAAKSPKAPNKSSKSEVEESDTSANVKLCLTVSGAASFADAAAALNKYVNG